MAAPRPRPLLLLSLLLYVHVHQHQYLLALNVTEQLLTPKGRAAWVLPEGRVKTAEDILRAASYPSETHYVLTEDGFILQLDRIPNPGRYPVFVANPILSSAVVYLYQGPQISLGYLLFDAGFDVWLGNYRGTIYSRDSVRFSETDDEYWKFGFHEHGVYDNVAFINFILRVTQRPDLAYVGFSMGSTSFLTMASMRPEMNERVRVALLQAPVASLYYTTNSLGKILIPIHNASEVIGDTLGIHLLPHSLLRLFGENFCPTNMGILCNEILWFLFDSIEREDYVANCPDLTSTWPSGGSLQTFWHYTQQADGEHEQLLKLNFIGDLYELEFVHSTMPGRFRLYNYALEKNLRLYGKPTPPDYPLQRITVPVFLYIGDSDTLCRPRDFAYLQSNLKNIMKVYRHPDPLFTHADFVFARTARTANVELIKDLNSALRNSRL